MSRSVALAQSVLGKVRQTSARVARILDVNRPAPTLYASRFAVSLVAVLAVACAAVYSRSPKLITFQKSPRAQAQAQVYESASLAVTPSVQHAEMTRGLAVTPVKVIQKSAGRKTVHAARIAALHPRSSKATEESLVHLTGSATTAVPYTETFWIVVESNGSINAQQQVHQIQMWRVTVLRNVTAAPTNPVPRKET